MVNEMPIRTLVVVSGGLSEESATHRLADALTRAVGRWVELEGYVELQVRRIDIRDLAQQIATASVSGFATGALAQAYEDLGAADAVIAVSPTYKASYTGLFKAFWDASADGLLAGVPVIVAATGGTARHSLMTDTAMRPLFAYLKALTLPTAIFASAEDWGSRSLSARIDEAARELVGHLELGTVVPEARNGSTARDESSTNSLRTLGDTRSRARDPFVNVPTMAQMLS